MYDIMQTFIMKFRENKVILESENDSIWDKSLSHNGLKSATAIIS